MAGDVGRCYEGDFTDAATLQTERIVLTGAFYDLQPKWTVNNRANHMSFYVVPGSPTIGPNMYGPGAETFVVYFSPSGAVRDVQIGSKTTLYPRRFDGRYVTAWRSSDRQTFNASSPIEAVPTIGAVPQTAWKRDGVPQGPVVASVSGKPATIRVDTAIRGLFVSRRYAEAMDARRMESGFVELKDVTIAGKRVASVFARVAQRSSSDLVAGIGIFPETTLLFTRGAGTEMTSRSCAGGVPVRTSSGVILVDGPGSGRHRSLLDTLDEHGPSKDYGYLEQTGVPIDHRAVGMFSAPIGTCSKKPIPMSFGGRAFGSDVVCSSGFPDMSERWDLRVGLHALRARQLLLDLRRNRMCWF